MKHYLIFVWGDVEPSLRGPYATDDERVAAARELRREKGDEHGMYRLDVPDGCEPAIDSFGGGELEPDEDEHGHKDTEDCLRCASCSRCSESVGDDELCSVCS